MRILISRLAIKNNFCQLVTDGLTYTIVIINAAAQKCVFE